MKRNLTLILAIALVTAITLLHNNCSNQAQFSILRQETVVGNPKTDSAMKVVTTACGVVARCFSGVSQTACENGVLAADGLDAALGLPSGSYSSGAEVVGAEDGSVIFGSNPATIACTQSVSALSCSDQTVQDAYNPAAANPFAGVAAMIPNQPGGCATIFDVSTFYLSPNGSDGNDGASAATPWKTFAKIFNSTRPLKPGDTVILLDGTYTKSTTGLPDNINCTTNTNSGTAANPVTFKAQNERRAFLKSDGSANGFNMQQCAFWKIEGLRIETDDLTRAQGGRQVGPFGIGYSSDIYVRRLLVAKPNRYFNAHLFLVSWSKNVVAEEVEAYSFHRAAFSAWHSHDITFRRCYANMRGGGQLPGTCQSDPQGDLPYCNLVGTNASNSAFSISQTSNSIVENCISENGTEGVNIGSGTASDNIVGGWDNKVLGVISLNDTRSGIVSHIYYPYTTGRNLFKDVISYGTRSTHSYYPRGTQLLTIENMTVMNNSAANSYAFVADQERDCTIYPNGCGFVVRNSLVANNVARGFGSSTPVNNWLFEYSNAFGNAAGNFLRNSGAITEALNDNAGNVRNSMSVAPSGMGLGAGQCLLWVPASSNMKGAGMGGGDIGANILYRYENGTLTTQRLWDRTTGEFPHGAVVAGVNDVPGGSLFDIHTRLNVNRNGCAFPAGY
jgi:hypothetical protein